MAFLTFRPNGGSSQEREFESLGHALHFAGQHGLLIFDAETDIYFSGFPGGWDLMLGGEVTGRHWSVRPWTTEELVGWYPTLKPGEAEGVELEWDCPNCGASPDHIWCLMRTDEPNVCSCQCGACGHWCVLTWEPVLEPYKRSRRAVDLT